MQTISERFCLVRHCNLAHRLRSGALQTRRQNSSFPVSPIRRYTHSPIRRYASPHHADTRLHTSRVQIQSSRGIRTRAETQQGGPERPSFFRVIDRKLYGHRSDKLKSSHTGYKWISAGRTHRTQGSLDYAGAKTMIVSPAQGQVRGSKTSGWSEFFPVDVPLQDADKMNSTHCCCREER